MDLEELLTYIKENTPPDSTIVSTIRAHKPDSRADFTSPWYGTTLPFAWNKCIEWYATMQGEAKYTLLTREVRKIMSDEEQRDMANAEGVTLSDVRRRLIKQAFPWLPEWNWQTRKATKATPSPDKLAPKDRMAIIQAKLPTQVDVVFSELEYIELKRIAEEKAKSLPEVVRAIVNNYLRRRKESTPRPEDA